MKPPKGFIERPLEGESKAAVTARNRELVTQLIETVGNGLAVQVPLRNGKNIGQMQQLLISSVGRLLAARGYKIRTQRLDDKSGFAVWAEKR